MDCDAVDIVMMCLAVSFCAFLFVLSLGIVVSLVALTVSGG